MRVFRLVGVAASLAIATTASAATVIVEVRDPQGGALAEAVVSAVPADGRDAPSRSRTAIMDQKGRTFVPHVLPVQVGTSVRFPNSDDIQHSVYSFSPAKPFQLPLYKGTPSNPIVFSAAGVVTLGCKIHDKMNAYIVVLDTPYFEKSDGAGRGEIRNLPAGKYAVSVWHPDMRDAPPPQVVTVNESDPATVSFSVTLAPVPLAPPASKLEEKFKKYGNGRP